jgi:hypothetical protein
LNAASGNDHQQVDASTLFIQQQTSAPMEMYTTKASNAIANDTTATTSRTRGLFSVHTCDNKQQPTTSTQALK